jgi:hypothetical protein
MRFQATVRNSRRRPRRRCFGRVSADPGTKGMQEGHSHRQSVAVQPQTQEPERRKAMGFTLSTVEEGTDLRKDGWETPYDSDEHHSWAAIDACGRTGFDRRHSTPAGAVRQVRGRSSGPEACPSGEHLPRACTRHRLHSWSAVDVTGPMGTRRKGRGSFIESVLEVVDTFHDTTIRKLRVWTPPASRRRSVPDTEPAADAELSLPSLLSQAGPEPAATPDATVPDDPSPPGDRTAERCTHSGHSWMPGLSRRRH